MQVKYFIGLLASAGAAAVVLAPTAAADPTCSSVAGGGSTGTGTTTCQTPGNVQISASAPDVPTYLYPWDDEFYGPALIIGPGDGHAAEAVADAARDREFAVEFPR